MVVDPSNFKALFDVPLANSATEAKPEASSQRRFFVFWGPRLTQEERQREVELRAFNSLANDAYPISLATRRKSWQYRWKNWLSLQSLDLLERLLSILPRR